MASESRLVNDSGARLHLANRLESNPRPSADEIRAEVIMAVYEAIRDLGGIPEGHLYAMVMGHMELETFNWIISTLDNMGRIRRSNHFLTVY